MKIVIWNSGALKTMNVKILGYNYHVEVLYVCIFRGKSGI